MRGQDLPGAMMDIEAGGDTDPKSAASNAGDVERQDRIDTLQGMPSMRLYGKAVRATDGCVNCPENMD
eukprot:SAG11_NODE_562_length_8523_cov_38.875356_8_plen_68_part_00